MFAPDNLNLTFWIHFILKIDVWKNYSLKIVEINVLINALEIVS